MGLRNVMMLAVVGVAAGAAQADVLWDQSAIDLNAPLSFANAVRTAGFGQREAYGMSDIHVGAGGWTIQSISVYMSTFAFSTPTTATLNVFAKTSSLPTAANNPRSTALGGSGTTVAVSVLQFEINGNSGQFANEVIASGLNLNLAEGDYWIGLTPRYVGSDADNQWPALSQWGSSQAVRFATPLDPSWTDNAAAFGAGPTDGAIKIQGVAVPAPASLSLVGLGALAAGRRRR